MNEKLEQAKNEIAEMYGYKDFVHYGIQSTFSYDHKTPEIINKVAERYHELMSNDIQEQIFSNYLNK